VAIIIAVMIKTLPMNITTITIISTVTAAELGESSGQVSSPRFIVFIITLVQGVVAPVITGVGASVVTGVVVTIIGLEVASRSETLLSGDTTFSAVTVMKYRTPAVRPTYHHLFYAPVHKFHASDMGIKEG
jgi:hypothetical protein